MEEKHQFFMQRAITLTHKGKASVGGNAFGASAEDAKKFGYVYTDLFYNSNQEKRYKEFNMHQLLRNEAIAVWED